MVDNGPDDRLWGEFFSALGWISRTTPLVPAAGNHEYPDPRKIPAAQRRITSLWRPRFTLPENGPEGLEETVFSFDYQGVRLENNTLQYRAYSLAKEPVDAFEIKK
jgi:hypothetical protein